LRFNKLGNQVLDRKTFLAQPLGEFLLENGFGKAFISDYLVPMGASIWSTSNEEMLEFPTSVFLEFFRNHGLLTIADHPQWQTVEGGSSAYVDAFLARFRGKVITNAKITGVERNSTLVRIMQQDGSVQEFDYVIFAVHADEVLPLLTAPSQEENALFGVWKYQKNHTILHADPSVLPPRKGAWASWNFTRESQQEKRNPVSIAYDMKRLQGLQTQEHYLVSLNRIQDIPTPKKIREILYYHPTFTTETVATRPGILALNGARRSFFVGSYFGYGFHEDAVRSSVQMIHKHFGIEL
jgi:predicted NAD/FAD-binding protein